MRRSRAAWLFGLVLAFGFLPSSGRADQIVKNDGESILAESISEATLERISYTAVGGRPATVRAADVASLGFTRAPGDFQAGENARLSESYDEAIRRYQRVVGNAQATPPVKDASAYYIGVCHLRAGNFAEAVTAFALLETQNASSFYLPQALLGKAEALLAAGDLPGAASAYGAIGVRYGERPAALAGFGNAEVLERQGKKDEAARAFESVADARAVSLPSVALRSRLRAARLRAALGQVDAAQRLVTAVEGNAGLDEAGRLTLGNVQAMLLTARATAAGDTPEARVMRLDALWAYLGSIVLYADGSSEEAEAFRGAIACARALGEEEKATQLEGELASRFPGAR
ncbi:MAG: hypothetical protein HY608_03095 [Planctomycetes bacterium]|nr:hypothetical protein [Planctomycetota bacterium]